MEKYSIVYQIKDNDDKLATLVLPIRGRGLWSTLYGFIALDVKDIAEGPEHVTVAGLTYYKHGETPGLGGEVDNKLWKAKWPGKLVFDENWAVKAEVSKTATTDYQVDALSGATLTSNGVTNMLKFWLGQNGFGPYLKNLAGTPKVKEPQTASLSESPTK
jgi:Na+-transporting NADH:ubiquinone oxidoreductase subunit C